MANLPEQKTVSHVDLPKFMGSWYVIANIPTYFEKGAVNSVEKYTWNQEKNRVEIDFSYEANEPGGKLKQIRQTGYIYDTETHAEWRVQPFWPLKFAYLVIDLAPDYSDTVIGRPGRENVWIMSRTKKMDQTRYNELVSKIQNLGYDTSKLQKVRQE